MKRVFLVHGWHGSLQSDFHPWLRQELEKRRFAVSVPALPDSGHPKMQAWLETLKKSVGTPDENCYFLGHSLGCITVLRYLESLSDNLQIGGTVLVAGFSDMEISLDEDEDIQEIKTFFENPLDFEKVKQHCKKFVAIHSDNDPYVDLRYADIFKEKLGADVIIEQQKGHFSGDDGITELPSALESVVKLAGD